MKITAIILVRDEECHIERAIKSALSVADRVFVIDSGSRDSTIDIARDLYVSVLHNKWINYSGQFNWALEQIPTDTEWVLRLDADEFLTDELKLEIESTLPNLKSNVMGVFVPRHIWFLGRPIRWGGLFPVKVLRLFRYGHGRCENRWMDEHIIIDGKTVELHGKLIDDNLKSISWWTEKHNHYASREAVDVLNFEYRFFPTETVADIRSGLQVGIKRWLKENIYLNSPIHFRAFAYFLYRYFLRLGFLDGWRGTAFHVLQGFWYRYLVDIKCLEVKSYIEKHSVSVETAIEQVLGIEIQSAEEIMTAISAHENLPQHLQ